MKRATLADRYCPIARSSSQIADGWTLVLVREFLFGASRFGELRERTGMSPRSLSLRLAELEADGIIDKTARADGTGVRYGLTDKGIDLYPVIMAIKAWGDRWLGPWEHDQAPLRVSHGGDGHEVQPTLTCGVCDQPIEPREVVVTMTDRMVDDRAFVATQTTRTEGVGARDGSGSATRQRPGRAATGEQQKRRGRG